MAERKRCNWVASLSDGSTHTEQAFIDANKPAYGSVLELMKAGNLKLTGFRLQRDGITHTGPSASPHAKFPSNVPFELDHRRRAAQSGLGEEFYCNYTAKVPGYVIKFWVDESTGDTWMQIEADKKV